MRKYITRFEGKFGFLSNFYPCKKGVSLGDNLGKYPSVEHAYQAAKTVDEDERVAIRDAGTPGKAKRMGQKVQLVDNWEEIKDSVMLRLLREKFNGVDDIVHYAFLKTKDVYLIEGNTWHDCYWGICYCDNCMGIGNNRLGELLMMVRAEQQIYYPKPELAIVKSFTNDEMVYETEDIVGDF